MRYELYEKYPSGMEVLATILKKAFPELSSDNDINILENAWKPITRLIKRYEIDEPATLMERVLGGNHDPLSSTKSHEKRIESDEYCLYNTEFYAYARGIAEFLYGIRTDVELLNETVDEFEWNEKNREKIQKEFSNDNEIDLEEIRRRIQKEISNNDNKNDMRNEVDKIFSSFSGIDWSNKSVQHDAYRDMIDSTDDSALNTESTIEDLNQKYDMQDRESDKKEKYPYESFVNKYMDPRNHYFSNRYKSNKNATMQNSSLIRDTILIGYLLIRNIKKENTLIDVYEYCLRILGIHDIGICLKTDMLGFSFDEYDKWSRSGKYYIKNKAILGFGATLYLSLYLAGKKEGVIIAESKRFYKVFSSLFQVADFMDKMGHRLIESQLDFKPRSIEQGDMIRKILPQEIYRIPTLTDSEYLTTESPISHMFDTKQGVKCIIQANTGSGKSMLFRMLTLGFMKNMVLEDKYKNELDEISQKLDIRGEKYVLYVPARMFSYCYEHEEYSKWTENIVELFFNCMQNLTLNFYNEDMKDDKLAIDNHESMSASDIGRILGLLADKGDLVVLVDSYDEIPNDKMRLDFLESLHRLYAKYKTDYRYNRVGGHFMIASRKLSMRSMRALSETMEFDYPSMTYYMNTDEKERREIVKRIYKLTHDGKTISKDDLNTVMNGHIYKDFSDNPYMLSFISSRYGKEEGNYAIEFSDIIDKFLDQYSKRMSSNHSKDKKQITDILEKRFVGYLKKIALRISIKGEHVFPVESINDYVKETLKLYDISDEECADIIEEINRIIVKEAGLIVPADDEKSDKYYKFINRRIQYELAARELCRQIEDDRWSDYNCLRFVNGTAASSEGSGIDRSCYLGIITSLVCRVKLGAREDKAEHIITDLIIHDNSDEFDFRECVADIFLGIYGSSIASTNSKDEQHSNRIQRIMLMRYRGCKDDAFIKDIKATSAYINHKEWVRDCFGKTVFSAK